MSQRGGGGIRPPDFGPILTAPPQIFRPWDMPAEDSKWTPSWLQVDSQQTPSWLQPGLSLESSFGELFWRAYLESPLKKLLWKLIVFHGFQKSHSQQPPGRLPVVSQGTPSGLPVDSQRTPSGLLADSQWIPIGLPADSQQTPSRLPADSHRIPSGLPADSQWTPSRLQPGLNLESSFGELFGGPIWRANWNNFFESSPWISQIILPSNTQQTPSKLSTDLNQVFICRPHLEIFFGELILESSFGVRGDSVIVLVGNSLYI